jgi:hypothetical protein
VSLSATRWTFALVGIASSLLEYVSAEVSAAESGVTGIVTISPARPGPAIAGEANSRPFASAEVQLRDAHGAIVGRTNTDSKGNFRIPAPGGQYQVRVDTHGALFPRCQPESAQIAEAQLTRVEISCDSGMR